MAQTTPNFGFNIAEGTDTVNLLTQCYPNFSSLDSILQGIKETGVTTAVATKTGTNFAVVRTDTDCNFFRFIATANYSAGDTFTVDGVSVTATSPAGTALPAGAFVINQSVIAVLNSSVLTLFVGGGAANIDAEDVDYDNSGSGLTATDVQAAIDELVTDLGDKADAATTYTKTEVDGLVEAKYSTAEKVIGKWVDGTSDVYEKTIVDAATTEAIVSSRHRYSTATLISGISRLISAEGSAKYSAGAFGFPGASFGGAMTGGYGGRIEVNGTGDLSAFIDYDSTLAGGFTITLTVRYLK